MKIEFQGRTWQVDTDEIGLRQAMVITSRLGSSLTGWEKTLTDPDSPQWLTAVECLYWLMLAQDGQQVPIGEVDFPVLKLAEAFADAALAEAKQTAAEQEPDPTKSAASNGAAAPQPATPVTG
jgi:hypothetical protein